VEGQSRKADGFRRRSGSEGHARKNDKIEIAAGLGKSLSVGWERLQHALDDHFGSLHIFPKARVSCEANEFLFRADGQPGEASLFYKAPVVRRNEKGWLMTARGHPLREPQ
jgi:hypothetical protein